ncbi:thioredoxin [bacterium]|jgi:thioredoxin 1|nr:thioredoxin [bacterium]NBX72039.1 thioredoxin [bacterium]
MSVIDMNKQILKEHLESSQPVILDFWAPWCGPCHQFAPVYEKVSHEFPNVVFGKINVVDNEEIAVDFQIRSIPKVCIIKDGEIIAENYGAIDAERFTAFINEHLG